VIRGINSGFSILTRALQASQWAVQLHLKNIANSNDPTYTRRTLENRADPFGRLPQVIRLRDQFIDFQYRRAQARARDEEIARKAQGARPAGDPDPYRKPVASDDLDDADQEEGEEDDVDVPGGVGRRAK